jgi:hypothetical protein
MDLERLRLRTEESTSAALAQQKEQQREQDKVQVLLQEAQTRLSAAL